MNIGTCRHLTTGLLLPRMSQISFSRDQTGGGVSRNPARGAARNKKRSLGCGAGGASTLAVRGGPMSRVLSRTTIYLGPALPLASSAQPERGAGHTMALLFTFAPDGACQAAVLPRRWWSLTPPFQLFPLRAANRPQVGVFFSAALSVGLPRLAVSQHPALWSPDFPHGARLLACPAVVWPTSRWRL